MYLRKIYWRIKRDMPFIKRKKKKICGIVCLVFYSWYNLRTCRNTLHLLGPAVTLCDSRCCFGRSFFKVWLSRAFVNCDLSLDFRSRKYWLNEYLSEVDCNMQNLRKFSKFHRTQVCQNVSFKFEKLTFWLCRSQGSSAEAVKSDPTNALGDALTKVVLPYDLQLSDGKKKVNEILERVKEI